MSTFDRPTRTLHWTDGDREAVGDWYHGSKPDKCDACDGAVVRGDSVWISAGLAVPGGLRGPVVMWCDSCASTAVVE